MKAIIRKAARIVTGILFGFFLLGTLACILQRRDLGTILFGAACAALFGYLYNRLRLHKPKRAAPQSQPVTTAPTYSRPSVSYASTPAPKRPELPDERRVGARFLYKGHIHDYVTFDTETTGLNTATARVVEIAAYRVRGSRVVDQFVTRINPRVPIPVEATAVHGITEQMLEGAPSSTEGLRAFFDFCGDDIIIGHNAERYDAPLLMAEAERHGLRFENRVADSIWISRIYFSDLKRHRLSDVCQAIGYQQQQAHSAQDDAYAVYAIVEAGRQRFHENPAL